MRRTFSSPLVLFALLLLVGGGVVYFLSAVVVPSRTGAKPVEDHDVSPDPAPADPRLTYVGPFRNLKPDVAYVGTEKCLPCHQAICHSYSSHPMGRSAELVAHAKIVEKYDDAANKPVLAQGYSLSVEKTADRVVHRMAVNNAEAPPAYAVTAHVAIGSGTRGRSYLTIEHDSVWQSPISWFSSESRWDVSPGFDLSQGGRRAIGSSCLFCHVDRVEPIPQAANRFREPVHQQMRAIGCERCHGPGALHVSERANSLEVRRPDTSIVNPKHLSEALQADVCAQCHLQGQVRVPRRGRSEFEFRPGLPFEEFVSVFVRHPNLADSGRSVGQFEQIEQSRCATASGGRLLCATCHDPHGTPPVADRVRFYRDKCNACHEQKPCTTPLEDRKANFDNCTSCHMVSKQSSNIVHASITDHRILRRATPATPVRGLPPGAVPLVPFRGGQPGPEMERDLGIALTNLVAGSSRASGPQEMLALLARDRLLGSLALWPGDVRARVAMSQTRARLGEESAWRDAAEIAVKLNPTDEFALSELASAETVRGNHERAETIYTTLIASNPRSVEHLAERALARISLRRWSEAEADSRAALKIHPLHIQTQLILGLCQHRQGDAEAGRKQLELALTLTTDVNHQRSLRDWYQRQIR